MTKDEARKLRPGDVVMCVKSEKGLITKGEAYVIGGEHYGAWDVALKESDNGKATGFSLSYYSGHFTLGGGPW